MLNKKQVDAEEEAIRHEIRALPDDTRAKVFSEVNEKIRDPDTYATLNYGLIAGFHHFYLGKYWRAVLEAILFLTGVYLIYYGGTIKNGHFLMFFGIAVTVALVVLELVALFRAQIIVQDFNNQKTRGILKNYSNSNK